jgi:hypothetical protein
MMDPLVVGPVASALVALAGLAFATIVQMSIDRRQRIQKSDELFLKALDFLGGGSQKRNLGISAIERYWADTRHKVSFIRIKTLFLRKSGSRVGIAAHQPPKNRT